MFYAAVPLSDSSPAASMTHKEEEGELASLKIAVNLL